MRIDAVRGGRRGMDEATGPVVGQTMERGPQRAASATFPEE